MRKLTNIMQNILVNPMASTWLTVLGTLFLSFATNLFANMWIWTKDPADYNDILRFVGGLVMAYLGYSLFAFLPEASAVMQYFQRYIMNPDSKVTLETGLRKFVADRLKEDSNVKLLRHLHRSITLCIFPFAMIMIKLAGARLRLKIVASLLALISLGGCHHSAPQQKPVSIGYQEIALYRHLFTAKEKGFFDQEGLRVDLKPFASANLLVDALLGNQLEATGLTNLQVALTLESKDPGKVRFVNFQTWRQKSFPDYILTRKAAGIHGLKDLQGHTIGLHPGSAIRAFAASILGKAGVDLNRTKMIELEPGIMQSAFVSGQVDALYCMDPAATTVMDTGQADVLVANPMRYIFDAPVPISGTMISERFLKERPEDAKKLARALDRSILYMREPDHASEIAGYIAKYTPISAQQALKMNTSEYWTSSEIDAARVQALANDFKQLGIVKTAVDVKGMVAPHWQ